MSKRLNRSKHRSSTPAEERAQAENNEGQNTLTMEMDEDFLGGCLLVMARRLVSHILGWRVPGMDTCTVITIRLNTP